ncbi:MAG: BMP family ABC transporter substrate-binding protein [Clostridia bacterium]
MKKIFAIVLAMAMLVTLAVGCTTTPAVAKLKIGMVTDSGTIDDKSFNQGTWEGAKKAADQLGLESKYLKPVGQTEADYLKEIQNLYDAGYKLIVCPGFKFATAIGKAQTKYPDAKFIFIDGQPDVGGVPTVGSNVVSIFFTEHESGFIAGVATAVELKEGPVGFIGGMEIPPVQKFNWGFQQGIKYANDNYGTKVTMDKQNFVYQGTFDNSAAGGQLAATMFDRGVKAIFCAAGGVGGGAILEAKDRALKGEKVWIIGVDGDQYKDGIYEGTKSIILTSAMKKVDVATYDEIIANNAGTFPGGKTLTFDVSNNGVGIPVDNPNLSAATIAKTVEVTAKIKDKTIVVSDKQGKLLK